MQQEYYKTEAVLSIFKISSVAVMTTSGFNRLNHDTHDKQNWEIFAKKKKPQILRITHLTLLYFFSSSFYP